MEYSKWEGPAGSGWVALEVDPAVFDTMDDDYASSGYDTKSLTDSINEYFYENGRRYHAYYGVDKNILPTDEVEQDRMNLHHEMFRLMLDGELHRAPLENPKKILDIGTGTGIWAIDMAEKYPGAQVIGTDLSPIQPEWVPWNCRFVVDDAELEFTYEDEFFDFVHARNIGQAISDWPRLMAEIYRVTKPGGYAELAELCAFPYSDDGTLPVDNGVKVMMDLFSMAMSRLGRIPVVTDTMLVELLENAGFEDITVAMYKQPGGPWPKDPKLKRVGAMNLLNGVSGYHAYGMSCFTRILGMSAEEADAICHAAQAADKNKNSHHWIPFYVVYGRKPLSGSGKGKEKEEQEPEVKEEDMVKGEKEKENESGKGKGKGKRRRKKKGKGKGKGKEKEGVEGEEMEDEVMGGCSAGSFTGSVQP